MTALERRGAPTTARGIFLVALVLDSRRAPAAELCGPIQSNEVFLITALALLRRGVAGGKLNYSVALGHYIGASRKRGRSAASRY